MPDPTATAEKDVLAAWLCNWWDGQENDAHAEQMPCALCLAQAKALRAAGMAGCAGGQCLLTVRTVEIDMSDVYLDDDEPVSPPGETT